MPYMRGLTEKGIDYDEATKEFFLKVPNAVAIQFLNLAFEKVPEKPARWRLRTPSLISQGASLVKTVTSGSATPETIALRKLSCFGDANTPACAGLDKTPEGSFCKFCRCGKWKLANMNGDMDGKLGWEYLPCPLKRPGFSNEVKS